MLVIDPVGARVPQFDRGLCLDWVLHMHDNISWFVPDAWVSFSFLLFQAGFYCFLSYLAYFFLLFFHHFWQGVVNWLPCYGEVTRCYEPEMGGFCCQLGSLLDNLTLAERQQMQVLVPFVVHHLGQDSYGFLEKFRLNFSEPVRLRIVYCRVPVGDAHLFAELLEVCGFQARFLVAFNVLDGGTVCLL